MFSFQIAQELRSPTIPNAPLTQIEFVVKNTRKRANRESELDSPIARSGNPPNRRYARMANAIARASCAELKIVLSKLFLPINCAPRAEAQTAITLTQCGAIAAVASTGMKESGSHNALNFFSGQPHCLSNHPRLVRYPPRVAGGIWVASLDRCNHEFKKFAVCLLKLSGDLVQLPEAEQRNREYERSNSPEL